MNCIIIDDDEISRRVLEEFILKSGFLTLTNSFSNPLEALTFLSGNKTDLIFLDIEMPDMNGMDFIDAINKQMPQVILITSHKEFAIHAFEHNVTDYIVKPLNYARFFKAVTKAKELAAL